ncbi:MAG: EF-hand domain-containing protein [Methylotenera sp.]|uniref:EF-hand domain-containing protein n=1 Tax=Methylotenera sp. TaxID=2051956 RepID=UPI0017D1877D|nr:EF-hand domain-containing protein [Methylotenera sp.]NOU25186.1 EF-hand domain-containing protein [Methylotenera sp.]
MKFTHLVTMAALALGLSQLAYANHDVADGKHCEHKHGVHDADTNKDGAISHDEFNAAHQAQADKMFTTMDANKDGKIDQAERDAIKANMKDHCTRKGHKKPAPDSVAK